jgi:hypothetical protein
MKIKEMLEDSRPRERLVKYGIENLSEFQAIVEATFTVIPSLINLVNFLKVFSECFPKFFFFPLIHLPSLLDRCLYKTKNLYDYCSLFKA